MPTTTATIRTMRWTDLEAVLPMEQELFPHDPWSAETFWAELARVPETRCYVVVHDADGAVLGYAGLFTAGDDADVQTIAVSPAAQGRGLGRLLLHSLVRTARDRDCRQLFLEVRSDNAAALRLYEREGFEQLGRRRDYYGSGVDALTMRAFLLREQNDDGRSA
jgi:[ribosomal protein S18]-alanine N-acetyltransferase